MTRLSITIDAPIDVVWKHISHIQAHTSWMADAQSIRLVSSTPDCVDARYVCVTKVGPLRVNDNMRVVLYDPPMSMVIEHIGSVKGTGEFRLEGKDERTEFHWEERLCFPWYMGGPIGKRVAMVVLHSIWRRNLIKLKSEIEQSIL